MADKDKLEKTKIQNQVKHVPKDVQIIVAVLKDMCVPDYESRVINQLLEFTYRYVTCIIDDARVFANHAKKKLIDSEDVKLAVMMTLERSWTTPLARDALVELARSKNNIPLPLVKPHCGLRLPADRYCVASCNFKLKPNAVPNKKPSKNMNIEGRPNVKMTNKMTAAIKRQVGGATLSTVAKSQTVSVPKPVFKFSTGNQKATTKPKYQGSSNSKGKVMEMDSDSVGGLKRKREDDDFETVQ